MKQTKPSALSYNPTLASLIIRCSLAAVFAYAAIDAFVEPAAWISFIPAFSAHFVDAKLALDAMSVIQLGLVVWLVSGVYVKYAAGFACLLLGGIMVANPSTFLITFRDIGLIGAAVALIFLESE